MQLHGTALTGRLQPTWHAVREDSASRRACSASTTAKAHSGSCSSHPSSACPHLGSWQWWQSSCLAVTRSCLSDPMTSRQQLRTQSCSCCACWGWDASGSSRPPREAQWAMWRSAGRQAQGGSASGVSTGRQAQGSSTGRQRQRHQQECGNMKAHDCTHPVHGGMRHLSTPRVHSASAAATPAAWRVQTMQPPQPPRTCRRTQLRQQLRSMPHHPHRGRGRHRLPPAQALCGARSLGVQCSAVCSRQQELSGS